jgi:hypothetical protein
MTNARKEDGTGAGGHLSWNFRASDNHYFIANPDSTTSPIFREYNVVLFLVHTERNE